jgi:hypothetical protein
MILGIGCNSVQTWPLNVDFHEFIACFLARIWLLDIAATHLTSTVLAVLVMQARCHVPGVNV